MYHLAALRSDQNTSRLSKFCARSFANTALSSRATVDAMASQLISLHNARYTHRDIHISHARSHLPDMVTLMGRHTQDRLNVIST